MLSGVLGMALEYQEILDQAALLTGKRNLRTQRAETFLYGGYLMLF